ncbi:MAG: ABC transporter permease [Polaribacter sp.]|nr:FtsX-like permease family protein [Polaribacter sp.]MDB4216564.1 ABC transporter permease [bacterium]MBT4779369.1 ABC transporter permease [Polaribacter sp.]MBT7705717.1 ABC transporter permease [Polaribacter sp.]MDA9093117.1 ABC transporter permease [Polaribacter sp.]MDA9289270.1 ABC transporter permease [Polaribacter sp.]
MNFSYYIAKRYLFSKTSNNAINIITIIASFGVIVGALALFIILSGFSGLRTFSYAMLDASDPDIKITATQGKSFLVTDAFSKVLDADASIAINSKVIEERVFLKYNNKEVIAFIKGVDRNFNQITQIDSVLDMGTWLDDRYLNTAVIGNGISYKLSLGVLNFGKPLEIYVPKPGVRFMTANNAFSKVNVQIVGTYSGTEDFANKYVFVNSLMARELLNFESNRITAMELKLVKDADADAVARRLQKQLGTAYQVKTKAQLNELYYKVINTENFVSYLIFTLIVIIALFNVIGAIIMMIIEKKSNLKTLFNLGVTIKEIKRIFVLQGFLLTFFGMLIGLSIGVVLVFLQQAFGWFKIVGEMPYPIEFRFSNLFIVIFTITILGFLASKIAGSRISKEFIDE